ncbi:hypothetical protein [Roseibium sp.]|uniref:hypothetical protein n=1 Tax=Roseibium sp. TaxID=1936156 RepID=UPI003A984858
MKKRVQQPLENLIGGQDNAITLRESTLQRRIRDRLETLDLTASDAARQAGIPANLIAATLRRPPDLPLDAIELASIAHALGTSVSWLVDGDEAPCQNDSLPDPIDNDLHAKATLAAIQSLETAGLVLAPKELSELILHLYKRLEVTQRP